MWRKRDKYFDQVFLYEDLLLDHMAVERGMLKVGFTQNEVSRGQVESRGSSVVVGLLKSSNTIYNYYSLLTTDSDLLDGWLRRTHVLTHVRTAGDHHVRVQAFARRHPQVRTSVEPVVQGEGEQSMVGRQLSAAHSPPQRPGCRPCGLAGVVLSGNVRLNGLNGLNGLVSAVRCAQVEPPQPGLFGKEPAHKRPAFRLDPLQGVSRYMYT